MAKIYEPGGDILLNAAPLKTYTSVTQLGLTSGSATISGAYSALPNDSVLIAQAGDFLSTDLPDTNGAVEMVRSRQQARGWFYFHNKAGADYVSCERYNIVRCYRWCEQQQRKLHY